MSRLSKALIAGLVTGITGLVLSLTPVGLYLEETIGLSLLFKLRGEREAPPDVVIVTMDKASADDLNISAEPEKWPRSLHARLTDTLAAEGAAVIAFDIIFEEPRLADHDELFARSISNAGNVVLCGYLKKETVPLNGDKGAPETQIRIETLLPPIAPLAESAAALSVFPLPKVPIRLSQYWTFKTSAGDTPTLPIVAFQVFALDVYEEFIGLLTELGADDADKLPHNMVEIIETRSVDKVIRLTREIFRNDPHLAENILLHAKKRAMNPEKKQIIRSLVKMYQGPSSVYLNFYGPPGTISTIPYYQALQNQQKSPFGKRQDEFKGKAVFVGLSESLRPEQQDGFYTVFSQQSGVDISGVEIAATAFANLLDDTPVRPFYIPAHMGMVFFWGFLLGFFCRYLPAVFAAVSVLVMSTLYLIVARYEFGHAHIWFPLVSLLFFQAPFAFFGAVMWQHFDTSRERQHIRKAFGYYLPEKVVDEIAENLGKIGSGGQTVYGTCLCTDAEQYTTLSETMDPKELKGVLNRYYEALFEPVRKHGGIISDVLGDSMMALWTTRHPDASLRNRACQAAVDIARAVHRFNQSSDALQLPTRIGLHSGHMAIGNVGAIDHYEYRAVGDIVNTVGRIERLNKQLGTQILVSAEVLHRLDGFLTRELGEFLFSGKSKPVVLYELLCRLEESEEKQRELCEFFAEGLRAYRNQAWEEASQRFCNCTQLAQEDKPSLYYLNMCETYGKNPPGEEWNGLVYIDKK